MKKEKNVKKATVSTGGIPFFGSNKVGSTTVKTHTGGIPLNISR